MLLNGFAGDPDSTERHRKIAVDAKEEIGQLCEIGPATDRIDSQAYLVVLIDRGTAGFDLEEQSVQQIERGLQLHAEG
ncbi:MAG: hypothetical protein ACJ8DC_07165 [Gemmatimonadales bacterium]